MKKLPCLILLLSFISNSHIYSQSLEFSMINLTAWEKEVMQVVDRYIANSEEYYYDGEIKNVMTSEEEWYQYRLSNIDYYDLSSWLKIERPDDGLPILMTVAEWGNEHWFLNAQRSDIERYNWESWIIQWSMNEIFKNDKPEEYYVTDIVLPSWKWKGDSRQNGESRATMTALSGATTENAAMFTRLHAAETELWLKDIAGMPIKPGMEIVPENQYTVPNKIIIVLGQMEIPDARGPVDSKMKILDYFKHARMRAAQNLLVRNMKENAAEFKTAVIKAGFNPVFVNGFKIEKENSISITTESNGTDVWGIALFGHGFGEINNNQIKPHALNGAFKFKELPNEIWIYPKTLGRGDVEKNSIVYKKHRLGLLMTYICCGKHKKWEELVAPKYGTYIGSLDLVFPSAGAGAMGKYDSWDQLLDVASSVYLEQ